MTGSLFLKMMLEHQNHLQRLQSRRCGDAGEAVVDAGAVDEAVDVDDVGKASQCRSATVEPIAAKVGWTTTAATN